MSEIKFSNFINEDGSHGPDLVGVTTFTSPHYFVPPSGTTAQRPSGDGLAPGMLRFNTDIGRLEVWRGDHWATILGESPNLGISTAPVGSSTIGTGARGLFGGGRNPSSTLNTIDFITISTLGNAQTFGSLTEARTYLSSSSSSTRGVFAGGYNPAGGDRNIISFITIASTGNAQDFGDLSQQRYGLGSLSNATRGVFGSGFGISPITVVNTIDYITIASNGTNAQDFGDLTVSRAGAGSCSSSTRGIFAGGYTPGTNYNTIDYITISTTGNGTDFGDLTVPNVYAAGCSNSTRGLFVGGNSPTPGSPSTNTIEFVTIASIGNSQDFGDLTRTANQPGACSSSTRGVFGGGTNTDNTIDYVTILTAGGAIDFGDLTQGRRNLAACSNAHGGL